MLLRTTASEDDRREAIRAIGLTPDAWRSIEHDIPVEEPKEKVTLYLDRSLVRLFRNMGRGYQARINRILVLWAKHVVARGQADYWLYEQEAQEQRARKPEVPGYDEARQRLLERAEFEAGYRLGQAEFRKEAVEKGWVVVPE